MSLDNDILSSFGGLERNSLLTIVEKVNDNDIDDDDFDPLSSHNDNDMHALQQSSYYNDAQFDSALSKFANNFSVLSLNIESINTSFDELVLFVADRIIKNCKLSVICLQECWLSDHSDISQFKLPGYNIFVTPRSCGAKGGLVMFIDDKFSAKPVQCSLRYPETWEAQFLSLRFNDNSKPFIIGNVYRPPRCEFSDFQLDFGEVVSQIFIIND